MIAVRSATVAPKRIQISRIAGSNPRASLRVRTVDKVGSGHEDRRPEDTARHLLRDADQGCSEQAVIARSEATRQSRNVRKTKELDCFATLAMTAGGGCSELPWTRRCSSRGNRNLSTALFFANTTITYREPPCFDETRLKQGAADTTDREPLHSPLSGSSQSRQHDG
jgi:hypothetical protein